MPMRNVPPFFNKKLAVQQDVIQKQYLKKTMRFFGEASRHMNLEDELPANDDSYHMPSVQNTHRSRMPPIEGASVSQSQALER